MNDGSIEEFADHRGVDDGLGSNVMFNVAVVAEGVG
jgi:hypothetical protein